MTYTMYCTYANECYEIRRVCKIKYFNLQIVGVAFVFWEFKVLITSPQGYNQMHSGQKPSWLKDCAIRICQTSQPEAISLPE